MLHNLHALQSSCRHLTKVSCVSKSVKHANCEAYSFTHCVYGIENQVATQLKRSR